MVPITPLADAWSIVQHLPAGTRVKLTLSDGVEATGSVVKMLADGVVMNNVDTAAKSLKGVRALGASSSLVFRGSDLTMATVVKMATQYSAGRGPTDAVTVRHVVTAIGVGQRVTVRTGASDQRSGQITALDADGFVLRRGSTEERVLYTAPLEVKAGRTLGRGAKIGIGAAVAGAAYLLLLVSAVTNPNF